jgi:large subunit ribosomal protein L2
MLKPRRPVTPSLRNRVDNVSQTAANQPVKSLLAKGVNRRSGRNNQGKITVRHRGGGAKRRYRLIDWKREKFGVPAKVAQIEYDPNRSANIALLNYTDGEKRYILAPKGVKMGDTLQSGPEAELISGNALPLRNIPLGMPIHNIEIQPGKGAQLVRGAGTAASIQSRDDKMATILLPSKEVRLISVDSLATIGEVGNPDHKNRKLGKAGRKRHLGIRPTVRGVAMHPGAHPHGGGEGKSGIGLKSPKSPWGKPTLGKKTRRARKYSDKWIIKDRRVK